MKDFFKKGDAVVVFLIISVCLVFIIMRNYSGGDRYALVYESGEITAKIELTDSESQIIPVTGGKLLKENGRIKYFESDCPDKLCEDFGWLEKVGDTASCVPNKTVVVVKSGRADYSPDVITY